MKGLQSDGDIKFLRFKSVTKVSNCQECKYAAYFKT